MNSEYFRLLDYYDFQNTAVRDEIYKSLKEKEQLELENKELKLRVRNLLQGMINEGQ